MGMVKKFGLIGYPLGHSFSKGYFEEKFRREDLKGYAYENFPLPDIAQFPALIREYPDLAGLNVTIPHKETVMPYLDEVTETARDIGAVNVIRFERANGLRLIGHNSDAYGFEHSLRPLLGETSKAALVLGSGGASKAVVYVLKKLGIAVTVVSREGAKNRISYPMVTEKVMRENTVIINTTPLGMSPDTHTLPPIPYNGLSADHILYDLVYNPAETRFLLEGKKAGAKVKNGLEMLHLQAEKAWNIWQE